MGKKILIVDDEAALQTILTVRLKKWGYEVDTASDGNEGLEKARSVNPDLILLDVMLPYLDGYKVCQMLKFDENFSEIPIIMLSARNQEEDKELGMSTGADRYMTKMGTPDFWQELQETIEELIGE